MVLLAGSLGVRSTHLAGVRAFELRDDTFKSKMKSAGSWQLLNVVTAAKLCSFLLVVETLFVQPVAHDQYKGDINEENLLFGRQSFPFVGAELLS